MGSLILCHNKKASQPYKITRIHRKIYTIEELCYYLCNNLYLLNYTIMNEKICEWLYSGTGYAGTGRRTSRSDPEKGDH